MQLADLSKNFGEIGKELQSMLVLKNRWYGFESALQAFPFGKNIQESAVNQHSIDGKEFVEVAFRLEIDEDGYPPTSTETLWAQKEGNGFRLDNTPFFARGVALGDIVYAVPVDGMLEYKWVLKRSGHGTVRVAMFGEGDVEKTREEFRKLGCSSELSHIPTLFAVDIPPMNDYSAVLSFLEQGFEKGQFDYEEGWVLW